MAGLRILARTGPGTLEVAIAEGERLRDYRLAFPARPDGVGDLHHARVGAVLPALGGAFIRLAGSLPGESDAFLPDRDATEPLTEGAPVAVRVNRAAQGGKGARLTARLDDTTRAAILAAPRGLFRRGPDALEAAAAAYPDAPVHIDDIHHAARLRPLLGDRLHRSDEPRAPWLDAVIATLAEPLVALPGGLVASIVSTPALVAIDVDTAGASAARMTKASAQFAANRDALPALLHAIRLRNLSGAIVIDLAGMAQRKRPALAPVIAGALAADPLAPKFLGFSGLGFAELLRPRIHAPLHELLATPQAALAAALRAWCSAPRSTRLRLARDLATALAEDPAARADCARLVGQALNDRADPTLSPGQWREETLS